MRPEGTKAVSITLTDEEHAEVKRLARKEGVHASTIIRAAMHHYHQHQGEHEHVDVREAARRFRITSEHLAAGTTPFDAAAEAERLRGVEAQERIL